MNEILYVALASAAGFLLGILFFGGLWFTVKKAVVLKNTALWFIASSLLRMSIVVTGIYYTAMGDWKKFLVCMLGFITARYVVMHLTRSNNEKQLKQQTAHEA